MVMTMKNLLSICTLVLLCGCTGDEVASRRPTTWPDVAMAAVIAVAMLAATGVKVSWSNDKKKPS
jgi:hypothetical protein